MFNSVAITFYSFALSALKVPLRAREFRCCREIPLVNQKLTFHERISCVTRHDEFLPKIHRAVSPQVSAFLRDFAKAEAVVVIVEPLKPNGKRVSL